MIVLDLEWNRGYDKKPLNEILQIGAVRLDRLGGPVVDVFNACIRPTVHKKFDLGAKKLPELAAFKASHQRFPGAAEAFRAWCGGDRVFAGWGRGDVEELNANCKYWGLPPVEAEEFFDFQQAFSHVLGTGQQIALWRAVEYCGIPDVFDYHSAVNDAMYTALVGAWLTPEALAWTPEPAAQRQARNRAAKLSQLPFPQQPRLKVGPFPTQAEVLDARSGRNPPCPLCGRKCGVARWNFIQAKRGAPSQYYGVFSCREHGRFLCRLTVARLEDGSWQGRRSVPAVTEELMGEYAAALQGGAHVCRGQRRRRRARRKDTG